LLRSFEQEIRLGYWPHVGFDWTDAVRCACELSAEHGLKLPVRGMDLFPVAVAIETVAERFLTFGKEQTVLAKAAGLRVVPAR
jgi:hypothetical protein